MTREHTTYIVETATEGMIRTGSEKTARTLAKTHKKSKLYQLVRLKKRA